MVELRGVEGAMGIDTNVMQLCKKKKENKFEADHFTYVMVSWKTSSLFFTTTSWS